MKIRNILVAIMIALGATALCASSGDSYSSYQNSYEDGYNQYNNYEDSDSYASSRASANRQRSIQQEDDLIIVDVSKSIPQYRDITTRQPYQECWDERVPVKTRSNGTVGSLIGGVAGGILGNQVGGGSGKTAATIGGAIVGTMVGNNLSKDSTSNTNNTTQYKTIRKCSKKYTSRHKRVVVAYKNIGFIDGQKVVKTSSRPLRTFRVRIRYIVE